MKLFRAIFLRLLYGLASLLFITFVAFVADEVAPGDAAVAFAGEKARPADIERLRQQMGLNRPWPVRYGEYLGKLAKLDFGTSYYGTKEPVMDIIKRGLPMTMLLAALAITLASIIGIFLGTIAAVYRTRAPDSAILTASTLGVSIPNFVLAPILVLLFAKGIGLLIGYLPEGWALPQNWEYSRVEPDYKYLILPIIVLAARPAALLTRLTRASMIDTMQQEFIRMAVAKGVPTGRLIFRHALRNAILPIITAIGTSFGFLLTGSFVMERFFTLPGLGRETIEAIQQGNTPVVLACILVTGAMFVVLNLIVDVILPLLDPRIREAQV